MVIFEQIHSETLSVNPEVSTGSLGFVLWHTLLLLLLLFTCVRSLVPSMGVTAVGLVMCGGGVCHCLPVVLF